MSSLAVIAVYSAGYVRTQASARRFENDGRKTRMAPQTASIPDSTAPALTDPELMATLTTPVVPELPPATPAPATVPAAPTPVPAAEEPKPVAVAAATPPAPPVADPTPVATPPAPVTATPAPGATTSTASTAPAAAATPSTKAAEVNPAPAESPIVSADVKPSKWKDGKFSGWGSCRHGDIEATVEIRGGRIVSAVVSKCRTVYSCNVIDKVIPQVVVRQSPDIDSVSGSTQSADSFYWAVYSALQDAEIKPAAAK